MRVLVTCVVSFVLAMLVGMFLLPGPAPKHKPSTSVSKPLRRQAQSAPLEMLPALPSLRATRTDAPSDQFQAAAPARQVVKARQSRGAERASSRSAIGVHPASMPARGNAMPKPAPATQERVPKMTPDQRPGPVPQTEIVATIPASGASQPPAPSTTLPSVPSPRDPNTPSSPSGRRPDPFTQQPPASALPPMPHVTQSTTPNVTPTSPSPRGPDYILGPGDQIEVNVPHLAVTVTIDPDGVIALPLISPVKAAGKTTAQLASDLTTMYSRVLNAPSVTVFVRQYRTQR